MKALDYLLEKVEPITLRVIENTKNESIKVGNEWTKRDETWVRLCVQHKLIQSVSKYIKQNDVITSVEPFVRNGNITARIVLKRGYINTEVILCGGYNIQRLHTRYIIDTNLPIKDENKAMVKELAKRKSNFGKLERLKNQVKVYEKQIENLTISIDKRKSMTKDEIIDAHDFADFYRKPYIEYDEEHIKSIERNYGKDLSTEELWKEHIEQVIYKDTILSSHESRIRMSEEQIKSMKKYNDKTNKQIKTLEKLI